MPKVSYLRPLIQVFDMAASLRFYRDLLGFSVVHASGPGDDFDWGWLRLDTADLMLDTAHEREPRPPAADPARAAAHADTGPFFGCENVDAVCRELLDKGLAPTRPEVRSYGMKQLYVSDPDGYLLCFQGPV